MVARSDEKLESGGGLSKFAPSKNVESGITKLNAIVVLAGDLKHAVKEPEATRSTDVAALAASHDAKET
jgi:metallophosphoesterase superfamily enzyme